MLSFAHTHPTTGSAASATLFIYYCPIKAKPRAKMFYSAAKALVLKVLGELGAPAAGGSVTNVEAR